MQRALYWTVPLAAGILWYTVITITQYLSNNSYYHDVGRNSFSLYSTLQGRFMLYLDDGMNFFGQHFCPILLSLVPLYAVFSHPLTYTLSAAVMLAAASWPLFLLADKILGDRVQAASIAVLYLCNRYVMSTHLAQHFDAFEPFFAFFAIYFALSFKTWPYLASLLGLLMVKEDVGFYWFFFGLYLAVKGRRRLGLATCLLAVSWSLLAIKVVMPWARAGAPAPSWFGYWVPEGQCIENAAPLVITKAGDLARSFLGSSFRQFLASTGYLALFNPLGFLLMLPPVGVLLLSENDGLRNLWYYYSIPAVPFLFFATLNGLRYILNMVNPPKSLGRAAVVAWVAGLCLYSLWTPTLTHGWRMRLFPITDHNRILPGLVEQHIPPDASVSVQYDLFCRVPYRESMALLDAGTIERMEYVLIDVKGLRGPLSPVEYRRILQTLVNGVAKDREIVASRDGYMIFRKGPPAKGEGP